MATTEAKDIKAHCNKCGQNTRHKLLYECKKRIDHDLASDVYMLHVYAMLECCGCETITIQLTSTFSEEEGESVTYYPPSISRRTPNWAKDLPDDQQTLLTEVYTALDADSRRLAMMGARSLIEVALMSKVGDLGTFPAMLDAGEAKGLLGKKSRDVLFAAFDAGSAVFHRGHNFKSSEVNKVIDIVEHLLQTVYILESLAKDIKKKTPQRKKKKKK